MTPELKGGRLKAEVGANMERVDAKKLTGYSGVGGGKLAADDCLICLCCLKLAVGLASLAEEVADELLGALVEVVEVLRHIWGFIIPTETKNRLSLIENIAVDCGR